MVFLGLVLVLIAAGAVFEMAKNGSASSLGVSLMDRTFALTPFQLFVAGVITTALFLLGLLMIIGGMRRATVERRRLLQIVADRERETELEELREPEARPHNR